MRERLRVTKGENDQERDGGLNVCWGKAGQSPQAEGVPMVATNFNLGKESKEGNEKYCSHLTLSFPFFFLKNYF